MSVESINTTNIAASMQSTASQEQRAVEVAPEVKARTDAQAAERVQASQEVSAEELQATVDKLNELMQSGQRNLNFSVDKDTDETVIKVMDTETQEVIRQFPSEEALKLSKDIEGMMGLIFNDHA